MKARYLLAGILLVAALVNPRSAPAMAQRAGDFELEIDAPWRMEPRDGAYGAIPIQVSIHDADQPSTSADRLLQQLIGISQTGVSKFDVIYTLLVRGAGPVIQAIGSAIESLFGIDLIPPDMFPPIVLLNRFQSIVVYEEIGGQFLPQRTFGLANIHEVEQTVGLWQYAADQSETESPFTPPPRPSHALCRRWQGQDCSGFAALRPTSEWNLTAMYSPADPTPGRDVQLRVDLRVSATKDGAAITKTYQRFLTVHLGEQPLPKFDDGNWAYGDLHYHSQGTDNDGESGYSYRGTLQAMAAMGLDFAFATDHASNSPQIGSATPTLTDELVQTIPRGLRDMSPDRFAFGIDLLNGPSGGNREVTSFPRPLGGGQLAAPQLFLGAEVDVTPEDKIGGESGIGNGPLVGVGLDACAKLPKFFKVLDQQNVINPVEDFTWCSSLRDVAMTDPKSDGRELVFDVQGPAFGNFLSTEFYARQHVLHLPVDGQNRDAFIPSNTSKYGGATRRLGEILNKELDEHQKGFAFLAHPFDRASGAGISRMGPDLVAYSQAQLEDAFKSEYVLGLQIWNENSLFSAEATDLAPFRSPFWQNQRQPFLDSHFQQWDIQQLFGLDTDRTDPLESWLGKDQPRRIFAAAGSDAHGDWNYRREGFFLGTSGAVDTAMGNPRNLVYVGEAQGSTIASASGSGRPLSQGQVVDGLRSGNFTLTDGPAVRVMIDVNDNGVIDAGDTPMGGVHEHEIDGPFKVIVEWKSSPEFAPVTSVNLLIGVWAKEITDKTNGYFPGIVYKPAFEGLRTDGDNAYIQPGPTGKTFVMESNLPYWYDLNPGNPLAITPSSSSEGYAGRRVVVIDPSLYPVGWNKCVLSEGTLRSSTGTTSVSNSLSSTTLTLTTSDGTTGGGTTTSGEGEVVYLQRSLEDQLKDLENGIDIPPTGCIRREFADATRPDRMFIRAQVRNDKAPGSDTDCGGNNPDPDEPEGVVDQILNPLPPPKPECVSRRAFTNPVWVNLPHCGNTNLSCLDPGVIDGALQLESSGSLPTSIQSGVTPQGTLTSTGSVTTTTGTLSAEQMAQLLSKLEPAATTGTVSSSTTLTPTRTTTSTSTTSSTTTRLGTTTLLTR